jgi:hypothetical protein
MSENEKKHECCCGCQCLKAIVIAVVLLAIGALIGHVITVKQCGPMGMNHPGGRMMPMMCPCCCAMMKGQCGDRWDEKFCPDKMDRECKGKFESKCREGKDQKGWFGHEIDKGKCPLGCTCPKCSKKGACLSEPNKAGCPMKK